MSVSDLVSRILPDDQRRAQVLTFIETPGSGTQRWYGDGNNGKTILARLVSAAHPEIQIRDDWHYPESNISKAGRTIIITNSHPDHDDVRAIHFDQHLDDALWLDLSSYDVRADFKTLLASYKERLVPVASELNVDR